MLSWLSVPLSLIRYEAGAGTVTYDSNSSAETDDTRGDGRFINLLGWRALNSQLDGLSRIGDMVGERMSRLLTNWDFGIRDGPDAIN